MLLEKKFQLNKNKILHDYISIFKIDYKKVCIITIYNGINNKKKLIIIAI